MTAQPSRARSILLDASTLLGAATLVAACARPPAAAPPPKQPTPPAPRITQPAVLDVPEAEQDAGTLTSRVTRVTVYSDRARVTRAATAEVTAEPQVFAFRGLPGWVDDGSVRLASSAGRIVDVRVDRDFLAKASDKSWQKAEAEHKRLERKLAALRDELAVLDEQKNQIESIKAFSLEKITQDTMIGDIDVKGYGDVVDFIGASLRKTAKSRRAVQRQIDELTPEYQASQRRLDDMKSLMKLEETTVMVTLQGDSPTATTVELTYMLPGVTWEPMHELRVDTTDQKKVEVVSFAAVTQTSGEDWGGAELSFSTQSTTQSVRIPELEALTLGDTQTAQRILTSQISSFTRAQQAFEGQNKLWNRYQHSRSAQRAMTNFEHAYQSNIEYLQVVQSKTVQLFESLEKRGTTAHYPAEVAPSIRGDGHPVRLRIGRSVLDSTQKIVAAPEQSLNAARTLAMVNTTGQPLLPGRVALYQDGAFLGMTDIDFIAKGEPFSMFLSVADQLKLSRELDRKHSALIRKRRTQMRVAFVVTVENLSAETTSFTLADRIPVSENKEIKVDHVKITPAVKADSKGILHWELTLKPKQKRQFRISYQVEYPPELILETHRKRMRRPAASPASPAPAEDYQLEDQILDLEKNF